MKIRDLNLNKNWNRLLIRVDFDNQPEDEQWFILEHLLFIWNNNIEHFKNKAIPIKSPEQNYNDWLKKENIFYMNELIKVTTNENNEPVISGRDLHKFLEVETPYHIWFPRMCEYGFAEGIDHCTILFNGDGFGKAATKTDHVLTLDMAKEISMIQRNDKGKQARQYFIQIEKEWNSPDKIMARALLMAEKTINHLQLETKIKDQRIAELEPKADYTDRILQSKGTVKTSAISKDYGMSAEKFNKLLHDLKIQYKQGDIWLLYAKYQSCGYTHSKTFDYIDSYGRQQTRMQTQWTQKGRLFLYDLLKYNGILPMIERDSVSKQGA